MPDQTMSSTFDSAASTFEHQRSLPREVPEAIRAAIWSITGLSGPARVLDIGAGTGRIGRAFVAAGDSYFGVDTSLAMLQEFSIDAVNCTLTQADGNHLPFSDRSFDVVLLMQVLSGVDDWTGILDEARRVVRVGGCVVVGRSSNPEWGVDTQLKKQLKHILEDIHLAPFPTEQSRRQAMALLESLAARHTHAVAASWHVLATPNAFLLRHRTGARFVALPPISRNRRLKSWARGPSPPLALLTPNSPKHAALK